MASVRGFCLNLPQQQQRRERLQRHLAGLGLPGPYTLFAARRGAVDPVERRGLSLGEDGLWRSVLDLLTQLTSGEALAGVDLIHLVEDDVELSPEFCRWVADLDFAGLPQDLDLLFTDMYMGPAVFSRRWSFFESAFAENRMHWLAGSEYTGCTSSWIIPVARLPRVLRLLRQGFDRPQRIPIDNQLRQCLQEGLLQGAISVPFLTSIDLASQAVSAIQDQSDRAVVATARVADLLRRRLSVLRDGCELEALLPLLADLVSPAQLSAHLGVLVEAIQQDKGFQYRVDPRLFDQPGNPQAKRPQTSRARSRSASGL